MNGSIPPKPTGFDAESRFHQEQWENTYGLRSRMIPSSTVRVDYTTRGRMLRAKQQSRGVVVSVYRNQYDAGDWLVCRTWNWESQTEGSVDILVAKPTTLRFSIADETIRGQAYTYQDYDASGARNVFYAGGSEVGGQYIDPQYTINSILFAIRAPTGLDGVFLLDMNSDGRKWVYSQYVLP